jgi:hypothetical protein
MLSLYDHNFPIKKIGTLQRNSRGQQGCYTFAKHVEALRKWNPSDLPKWLDEDTYRREILPRLVKFTVKAIRLRLGVSHPYATLIKRGLRIPHPRHWMPLAELAGYQR